MTNLSLFLSITFVVSASPGPVMLSCMANGARFGLRKAVVGMLGASAGNLCLVLLSALGLGLIISQHPYLFNIIKWLGAGYLVWLGAQMLGSLLTAIPAANTSRADGQEQTGRSAFLIALSNPKGLIYFGALFPQFIDYTQPIAGQFLLLTLTFLVIDLVWMFVYALAGKSIMLWLKTPQNQVLFKRISGSLLIGAGIFVALSGNNT